MHKRRKGESLDRKFEKDQVVGKPVVEAYSLEDKEDSKAIEEAVAGGQSVKKIFSANQEDLVEAKPNRGSIGITSGRSARSR